MADFATALKTDLVEQFKGKPNIEALMEVISIELQQVYDFYEELRDNRDVMSAVGKQLDGVGDIVALTRMEAGILAGNPIPFEVINDDMYRQYLIFKILKNTCDCTYPDIIKAFRMFWDRPLYYTEDPEQPATMIFDTGEMDGSVDTRPLFDTPLIRAAGVTLKLYARTKTEMETTTVYIGNGLGFAVTVTNLPHLEREYDFRSKAKLIGGFQRITEDTLPNIEREYDFRSEAAIVGGFQRITEDTVPEIEREYKFGFKFNLGAGLQSISQDDLPFIERKISFSSHMESGGAVHSIMETPISGISILNKAKTEREETENE